MKRIQSLIQGLVACGVVLAMVATANAQNVTQGKAKVIKIKGKARYNPGNGIWQELKVGDVLKAGSVIQTDTSKGSYVDLVLGDGTGPLPNPSVSSSSSSANSAPPPKPTPASHYQPTSDQNFVRVWENSALGIDKLTSMETGADTITDTQLDLRTGHIFGSVKKMSAASKYEVKIPNGVAGIRGTNYDISSDGVVRVSSGSVVVAWVAADGTITTQVVNGGNQFDARTGQVSPLSQDAVQSMESTGAQMNASIRGAGPEKNELGFMVNQTLYYVSPTTDN